MNSKRYTVKGTDFTGGADGYESIRAAIGAARERINASLFRDNVLIARTVKRSVYTARASDVLNGCVGWTEAFMVLPTAGVTLTSDERRFLFPTT